MTTAAEPVLLDTNVLLDATNELRPRHAAAVAAIEEGNGVICAQVAREYLAVASRDPRASGLGLSMTEALENLAELRRFLPLLPEEKPVLPELLALLERVSCQGKVVHDAALVATMQAHGVRELLTANPAHFDRFGDIISVRELG